MNAILCKQAIALTLFLAFASAATADEQSVKSLKGVISLDLTFSFMELSETTERDIQTDVELKLRQARIAIGDINVFPSNGHPVTTPPKRSLRPTLRVHVTGGQHCLLDVSVLQSVSLRRDARIVIDDVPTWGADWSAMMERIDSGEDAPCDPRAKARDLIDRLINAWLKANSTT